MCRLSLLHRATGWFATSAVESSSGDDEGDEDEEGEEMEAEDNSPQQKVGGDYAGQDDEGTVSV